MKPRNFFIIVVIVTGLAGAGMVLAQCGPSGCESNSCGVSQQPDYMPARPQWREPQSKIESKYPALVIMKFIAPDRSETMVGSGFIIDRDMKRGTASVLTCAHGYKTLMRIEVWIKGTGYKTRLLGIDPVQDVCLLEIADPGIDPLVLADTEPTIGEKVYACGFAHGQTFFGTWGTLKMRLMPVPSGEETFIETTCAVQEGCSGGPILNAKGKVIGLITGGGGNAGVTGPCFPLVRKVLKFLLPPYQNRTDIAVVEKLPIPISPAPTPAPSIPQDNGELVALKTEIESLKGQIEILTHDLAEFAKQQPIKGDPGPPGPQGIPGKDALPLAFKPITFVIADKDGNQISDEATISLGDPAYPKGHRVILQLRDFTTK